jgi:hypothetical protein
VSALALAGACMLLPAAASAKEAQVFVRTPGTITQMGLDRSGRAAWIQLAPSGQCYRIHRGALLRHENVIVTRCAMPEGPVDISALVGPIVASARTAGAPLHIAWAQHGVSYNETWASVWVPAPDRGRTRVAAFDIYCGINGCGSAGRMLGAMASNGGVVLYGVNDLIVPASCPPDGYCEPTVGGGRIRRIHYAAGGVHVTTIPGAPAAATLATAGGRLAEQLYTPQGAPSSTIELRDLATGALDSTITLNGTLDAMAMSQKRLAVLVTNASGNHLIRYDPATGARLGSTPLPATLDRTTLSVYGPRILYQTAAGMFIYRTDLGRSIPVGIRRRANATLDRDGIRWITSGIWTVAHGGPPSAIRGIPY